MLTHLLVIAAHHLHDNVAAQRFKGLTKYIAASGVGIDVIAEGESGPTKSTPSGDVYPVAGPRIGSGLTRIDELRVVAFALTGFWMNWLLPRESWLANILRHPVVSGKGEGRYSAIVATYSPLDALIAARAVAKKLAVPVVLDFRDGFAFESLGRAGSVVKFLRRLVERRLVEGASLVTTVSKPLADHFSYSYPSTRVEILPNGYEPFASIESVSVEAIQPIARQLRSDRIKIGHFGRVSASDATRFGALKALVQDLTDSRQADRVQLLFVGTLTDSEVKLLKSPGLDVVTQALVSRAEAHALMQEVDVLLLLTGAGTGCATGKIFEYIAAKKPIVCVSMVENEAAHILKATGTGQSIVVGSRDRFGDVVGMMVSNSSNGMRDELAIGRYRRDVQSEQLASWLAELVAQGKPDGRV